MGNFCLCSLLKSRKSSVLSNVLFREKGSDSWFCSSCFPFVLDNHVVVVMIVVVIIQMSKNKCFYLYLNTF